ncbi:MAG: hypothetical protein AAGD25_34105 [Cyanobacteria bacterium P01_F01_bin.150]
MNTLGKRYTSTPLMSPLRITLALVTGLITITTVAALTSATAQPSMAQSKQPSPNLEDTSHSIIPVTRIDPEQPISIVIFNDTDIPIEYGFSTNQLAPQPLSSQDTITIESAPIPTALLINAFTPAAVLDYAVESIDEDNTLYVIVSLVDQLYDASGFSAIDIHETGAIYLY